MDIDLEFSFKPSVFYDKLQNRSQIKFKKIRYPGNHSYRSCFVNRVNVMRGLLLCYIYET